LESKKSNGVLAVGSLMAETLSARHFQDGNDGGTAVALID